MDGSNRRQVLKLGVVDLGVEHVSLPNGVEIDLAVIRHPGAAAIVALDEAGNIAMLYQYRHAIGGYLWEIPAGCRNAGETPLQCAHRELAEEAGLSARAMGSSRSDSDDTEFLRRAHRLVPRAGARRRERYAGCR